VSEKGSVRFVGGLHEVVSVFVIEHSENVNSWSFEQSTPLHLASKEGRIEVVRFLVEHDADAATKDKHGWTPLHRASSSGDLDLAIIFMTMSVMGAQIRGTFVQMSSLLRKLSMDSNKSTRAS